MQLSKKLTVKVRGGIGNQLFIFSAALVAKRASGVAPVFDFLDARAGIANHGNSIEPFLRELGYDCKPRPRSRYGAMAVSVLDRLSTRMRSRIGMDKNNFMGKNPGWSGDLTKISGNGGPLSGYFQAHAYVEQAGSPLEELLSKIRNVCDTSCSGFGSRGDFAAVHARRGDYLSIAKDLGAIDLKSMKDQLGNWSQGLPVIVHSDDSSFAEELASSLPDGRAYRPIDNNQSDFHELVHLSRAKHFFLTNSSFGWWAAYMSGSKDVTVPSPWFRNAEDPEGLIPSHWKKYEPQWLK